MAIPHVYGIRAVAGASMLFSIAMMLMAGYVFVSRLEDLKSSKFPASNLPQNLSSHEDPKLNKKYHELLEMIQELWAKNRPLLVSSSMLAILAGLIQCIFSGLVVLSDSKVISLYIRKWVTVHFILIFVLFIIIMNTIVLTQNSKDNKAWSDMLMELEKCLKNSKARSKNDYSGLYRFLNSGQLLIYIGVGIDMPMLIILMGTMMFLMRNYNGGGYEQYE